MNLLTKLLNAFKVNRVVKYFVLSDLVLFSGWGLVSPVFSVFVIEEVKDATLLTVGISASIYWLARSLIQIPVANMLDKTEGERDDFNVLVWGLVLASLSAFIFSTIESVRALYLLQILHGVAFGLYSPSWSAIFSRHLDKNRIAFDWSLNSTTLGLASGVTGFLGGYLAAHFGFDAVFVGAGIMSLVAAFLIFSAPELILPKPPKPLPPVRLDHTPRTTPH